jgi:hypothetical protein
MVPLFETLLWLMLVIENKLHTIGRLYRLIFGPRTEKTNNIFPKDPAVNPSNKPDSKPRGHGRNGSKQYPGAQRVTVPLKGLSSGQGCPDCQKGKLYEVKTPGTILRITAQPLVNATIFELAKLRCNLCGKVFTATPPPEAQTCKYDSNVGLMIGLMHYGNGMPFYRMEQHQKNLGIPLPSAVQWELAQKSLAPMMPVHSALLNLGANGSILHNDDTKMRVASLRKEIALNPDKNARKGIFTTNIISRVEDHTIALFFTGRNHAGENLNQLLSLRDLELAEPIQMCDALSHNQAKEFKTILSHCLTHARRNFTDVSDRFPQECRHVLDLIGDVYRYDAQAREQKLSPQQRLLYHQELSRPVMTTLQSWMKEQIDQKKVEPNSGLGQAIAYMQKYWESLTLFLRQSGAPLDNNICERALKMAILHRKNSLSYKTETGARVGDVYMSLIHTCRLNGVNAFLYMNVLTQNALQVAANPELWLPWNFHVPGTSSN